MSTPLLHSEGDWTQKELGVYIRSLQILFSKFCKGHILGLQINSNCELYSYTGVQGFPTFCNTRPTQMVIWLSSVALDTCSLCYVSVRQRKLFNISESFDRTLVLAAIFSLFRFILGFLIFLRLRHSACFSCSFSLRKTLFVTMYPRWMYLIPPRRKHFTHTYITAAPNNQSTPRCRECVPFSLWKSTTRVIWLRCPNLYAHLYGITKSQYFFNYFKLFKWYDGSLTAT